VTSFVPLEYNKLLLKIYDLSIVQHQKVTFSLLSEFFPKKELCKSLDYLCNKCVVDDHWDKSSGVWVRTFEIPMQYRDFVEKLASIQAVTQ